MLKIVICCKIDIFLVDEYKIAFGLNRTACFDDNLCPTAAALAYSTSCDSQPDCDKKQAIVKANQIVLIPAGLFELSRVNPTR